MKKKYIIALVISVLYSVIFGQSVKIQMPLRFDHYYTYEQSIEAIKLLNQTYPEFTKIEVIGKSEENRDIWALTINNPKTGKDTDKPGVYVDGNIHGNEVQATEVCLYFANYLLTNYNKSAQVKKMVDKNAYYIVPVVNVDGRYHFFADAGMANSFRGLRIPKDDDRDGLIDEDSPDDLDKDGNICVMRKKDTYGNYKADPEDPRIMVRIKQGEKGEWTMLGAEGIDNDNDGKVNEDSDGFFDPNRNWGHVWMPEYVQSGSGKYPFSSTTVRVLRDFVTSKDNLIVCYAFHNSGGMFLRGPAAKVEGELPQKDLDVYDFLGKNSEKIVPGYQYLLSWKDLYTTYGDFTDFVENIMGAYSFVTELFKSENEFFEPKTNTDNLVEISRSDQMKDRLKFNDYLMQGMMFVPWHLYQHPVYGEIEIGGWIKQSGRSPQPFMLLEEVHRNASVIMFTAAQTPEISMDVYEVKKMDNDLYRVRVRLSNVCAIPSMSYLSINRRLFNQDYLKISGVKVIAGGKLLNKYTNETLYKENKPEVQFFSIPANDEIEFQYIVKGSGSFTISYISHKAGKIFRTVSLES